MSTTKTHLSLNVRDVERSARFYEAFFGAPVHKRRPGYANFDLETPALKLALNEKPSVEKGGPLNHLGVVVDSPQEVEAARERLVAAGMATFDEKDVTCCYARQDKVWVHDPDGNAWEVYTITDDMLDAEHSESGCGPDCATEKDGCCGDRAETVCCA